MKGHYQYYKESVLGNYGYCNTKTNSVLKQMLSHVNISTTLMAILWYITILVKTLIINNIIYHIKLSKIIFVFDRSMSFIILR